MLGWLTDIIAALGESIGDSFQFLGEQISNVIFDTMLQWLYNTIYDAAAAFFTSMGNLGAEIFDLPWVQAVIRLFTLFGWSLFAAGVVVAVFDVAIEYQNGRANIIGTTLNILKGFFSCSLFGVLPVELYVFCITLQNTFAGDLTRILTSDVVANLPETSIGILSAVLGPEIVTTSLFMLLTLIVFAYCSVKIFFANIKRGGILLTQIAVGSLYMFSVPRGYTDGFIQWCKQIIALCLTAFLQTTLLFLGMITFSEHQLLGIGIMLAANEVPRVAQQFGLDTSAHFHMTSVVHATSTAVNLARGLAKAV